MYSRCKKIEELPCKYFYLFYKQNDKNKESFKCKHKHCKNVTFWVNKCRLISGYFGIFHGHFGKLSNHSNSDQWKIGKTELTNY